MNRKRKKKLREQRSTRQLMGIDQLTGHGLKTAHGELAFFLVRPDNLSVLSAEGVRSRILSLTGLLEGTDRVRLLALDSRESFQSNKDWYRQRMEEEELPALRDLLRRDSQYLDDVQTSTASSREFALVFQLDRRDGEDIRGRLSLLEKSIQDQGFRVRLATDQDVKRLLAVYYQQDAVTEHFEDYDGERWFVIRQKENKGNTIKPQPKDFLDLIAPTAAKFNTDHYILGGTYRCVLALRGYPTSTENLALLRNLGEKSGVTLAIDVRKVTSAEERQIIHNAANKNRMERSNTYDLQQSVTAEANLRDVTKLVDTMHQNQESLLHCAVYLELAARDLNGLNALRDETMAELTRSRLSADRLLLRQREGFLSVNPAGYSAFGTQFERVLPASSVANLFPFNYSGKTDPQGFYIGRDKYGSNIIVDLDRRADDKTNGNILILGNSGQGKSYLLKLLICNLRETGKSVISLDPEHELEELAGELGGCFVDLMSGQYLINPLEPKLWDTEGGDDPEAPDAFRRRSRLSQHISFLKDFFRSYKAFSDCQLDTIELMLERLYAQWGLDDDADFSQLKARDYPILSDLYAVTEDAYQNYDRKENPLYPAELLREVLLGLHSMCLGAESKFFNGCTNITSDRFLVFGMKGLDQASGGLKNALLFNVLSYLSNKLLTEGSAVAAIDELHVFLSNPVAIEYIRSCMKRARKKDSSVLTASQNLEDFTLPGVAEMTRPLFSIPTHQFLFNAGSIDRKFYMDNLQLEPSEYELIRYPQRGVCLYKCGNERYLLEVHAPEYKAEKFGKAGGK